MPDGELRRPPQLWEQRLARTTSVLAAGVSNGDATSIVSPTPPPGSDIGVEPAPVLPPPGDFVAPSTPTLISSVQGINVVWNGLNSAGDLWPSDTSYVEVHMDTSGPTFTVGTATLKGRLARPGGLAVTGLSRGTTYYFRLRGADAAGNVTAAGTAASAQPGQINAPDIAANAITANSIVAGTITGWSINSAYLSGGTISGGYITGGTVSGGFITGGTIEGTRFETRAGASRIRIDDDVVGPYGTADAIEFVNGSASKALITWVAAGANSLDFYSDKFAFTSRDGAGARDTRLDVYGTAAVAGPLSADSLTLSFDADVGTSLSVGGTVSAAGIDTEADARIFNGYRTTTGPGNVIMRLTSNVTNTNEAKFEVDADGDVKSRTNSYAGFSDARQKANITPARNYLDDLRQVEIVTFNWQGSDQKLLGVTAQQIQPIFPNMVAEDEDGTLSVRYSVFVPMLITAVQSLADQVDELTARIEALEA